MRRDYITAMVFDYILSGPTLEGLRNIRRWNEDETLIKEIEDMSAEDIIKFSMSSPTIYGTIDNIRSDIVIKIIQEIQKKFPETSPVVINTRKIEPEIDEGDFCFEDEIYCWDVVYVKLYSEVRFYKSNIKLKEFATALQKETIEMKNGVISFLDIPEIKILKNKSELGNFLSKFEFVIEEWSTDIKGVEDGLRI